VIFVEYEPSEAEEAGEEAAKRFARSPGEEDAAKGQWSDAERDGGNEKSNSDPIYVAEIESRRGFLMRLSLVQKQRDRYQRNDEKGQIDVEQPLPFRLLHDQPSQDRAGGAAKREGPVDDAEPQSTSSKWDQLCHQELGHDDDASRANALECSTPNHLTDVLSRHANSSTNQVKG
jgi:hypothetical protein